MNPDNYKLFCDQLKDTAKDFPNLSIIETDNKKILKGILDIPDDNMAIVGSYLIEIHFTNGFPFRFPKLFEKGGMICNHINWHKYPDNSCCITVLPDEILKCKFGITVIEFIKKYCFSFFANHIHRKLKGKYMNGEYSHGPKGLEEFYIDLLKTNDTSIWVKYFEHVFKASIFATNRNEDCFCGSEIKFKKCHNLIFSRMWDIGRHQIYSDFKSILS